MSSPTSNSDSSSWHESDSLLRAFEDIITKKSKRLQRLRILKSNRTTTRAFLASTLPALQNAVQVQPDNEEYWEELEHTLLHEKQLTRQATALRRSEVWLMADIRKMRDRLAERQREFAKQKEERRHWREAYQRMEEASDETDKPASFLIVKLKVSPEKLRTLSDDSQHSLVVKLQLGEENLKSALEGNRQSNSTNGNQGSDVEMEDVASDSGW